MKKIIMFLLAAMAMFAGMTTVVSAEEYSDKVTVVIDTKWRESQSINKAYFDLYTKDGKHLGTQETEVMTNNQSVITFQTLPYKTGEEFVLKMNYGYAVLQYYDNLICDGGEFVLGTYAYTDENGQTMVNDTFYMTGVPYSAPKTNFLVDGKVIPMDIKSYNGVPMAPMDLLLEAIGVAWYEQDYDYITRNITISHNDITLVMNMDNELTFINDVPNTIDTGVKFVDDRFYAPIGYIANTFGIPVTVDNVDGHININAVLPKVEEPVVTEVAYEVSNSDNAAEDFVNSSGVSSKTDYLIWVSKKDYTVNVFLGSKGNWDLCRSMSCGIGKANTPTITGQFEYYSRESRWTYANYYVGPIMRFKGGYAIHSTLLKYNGEDYDARVGMKISHGCVRVRKPDIEWLVSYVPLHTKIYITE